MTKSTVLLILCFAYLVQATAHVFGNFEENSCEILEGEVCISCTIIVANQPIQPINSIADEEEGLTNIDLHSPDILTLPATLVWDNRIVCEDENAADCVIKPIVTIHPDAHHRHPEYRPPEGYEIIISDSGGQYNLAFFELDIDSDLFKQMNYPSVTLEYFPDFEFLPATNYSISLFPLPKTTTSHDPFANWLVTDIETPPLPQQIPSEKDVWTAKSTQCTNRVWCYRGENCHVPSDSSYGVVQSFFIAFFICGFFIICFFCVMVIARRRIDRGDDTEMLYEEDAYYEDEPPALNGTEMKQIGGNPSEGTPNGAVDTSGNSDRQPPDLSKEQMGNVAL